MKKLLLLLSLVTAVFASVVIPLACSHDEEEKSANKTDKLLREFPGSVKYGEMVTDSASASLTEKADGTIELTLETGLPLYQFTFSNITVSQQADSTVLRAKNETIDAGNDNQFTLKLSGFLKDSTLFIEVAGNELTAPLFFSTNKVLLESAKGDDCQADGPTANYLEAYNCQWEGKVSVAGENPVPISFHSVLTETGDFSIDLGTCNFSEKMPEAEIKLDELCFFMAEAGFPEFSFAGNEASVRIQGQMGSVPATIDGCFANDTLKFDMEITVAGKPMTIDVTEAWVVK